MTPILQANQLAENFSLKKFKRISVGCLVLSNDNRIVLQHRDDKAPTFPNYLSLFGGGLEPNESPLDGLVRELKEELGANVNSGDVISFGAFTTSATNHEELHYLYFWYDTLNTITGCYEGTAKYYYSITEARKHPHITEDTEWLLLACLSCNLIS